MHLVKYYLTENDCYKQGKPLKPAGICMHTTAADNPYLHRYIGPDDGKLGPNAYNNHWNRPGVDKCAHAMIGWLDNQQIATYQCLPWDMRGWHSGSGKNGNGNDYYIGIEMCEHGNNESYFDELLSEAVELVVYLCKMFGFTGDNIVDHAQLHRMGLASNHSDINPYFNKFDESIKSFRQTVDYYLNMEDKDMFAVVIKGFDSKERAEELKALLLKADVVEYDDEKPTPKPEPEPQPIELKVGDAVKMAPGCNTFIDGQTMAGWVTTSKLYIRKMEQNGNVSLVSTEPVKDVYTGRVYTKDLVKW